MANITKSGMPFGLFQDLHGNATKADFDKLADPVTKTIPMANMFAAVDSLVKTQDSRLTATSSKNINANDPNSFQCSQVPKFASQPPKSPYLDVELDLTTTSTVGFLTVSTGISYTFGTKQWALIQSAGLVSTISASQTVDVTVIFRNQPSDAHEKYVQVSTSTDVDPFGVQLTLAANEGWVYHVRWI